MLGHRKQKLTATEKRLARAEDWALDLKYEERVLAQSLAKARARKREIDLVVDRLRAIPKPAK